MLCKIGFLAKLTAGHRLKRKTPPKAANSHPAISKTVKLVTTGSGVRIMSVIITPKEIPLRSLKAERLSFASKE
jgi:hypothetical protein